MSDRAGDPRGNVDDPSSDRLTLFWDPRKVETSAMAQINPRTFADAKQLGDQIYELILTNWGNRGLAQDPDNGSISYPPVKKNANGTVPIIGTFTLPPIPSLSAIAIAPRSDLDRCILNFSTLPQADTSLTEPFIPIDNPGSDDPGFVARGGILATEQVLAVGASLVGQLNGPIIVRAHPAHWFGDTYVQDGSIANSPYGTALPTTSLVNPDRPVWTNPQLRLLLYLNGRAALPPAHRAPFHKDRVHIFSGAAEELLIVVPIMGRKFVRVAYRAAVSDHTVRITGTFHTPFRPGVLGDIDANDWEVPLVGPTIVPADTAMAFTCECQLGPHPNISYLLLKVSAGVLQLARFTIDAYD